MPGMKDWLHSNRHLSDMQIMTLSPCIRSHVGYKKQSRSVTCPGQRAHLELSRFETCPGQYAHSSSCRLDTCPGQCAQSRRPETCPGQRALKSLGRTATCPGQRARKFLSAGRYLLRAVPSNNNKDPTAQGSDRAEWLSPETMMRRSTTPWMS